MVCILNNSTGTSRALNQLGQTSVIQLLFVLVFRCVLYLKSHSKKMVEGFTQ